MLTDKQYMNQSEAARIYACTAPAIRAAMAKGKALHKAVVKRNGKRVIDMHSEAALAYRISDRVSDPTSAQRAITNDPTKAGPGVSFEAPEHIRDCLDWTLREVIERHGTDAGFEKWLSATDKIETIHGKRLLADRSTGELIGRDYVRKHVMGLLEKVHKRLLDEMPQKLSVRMHELCETGATVESLQKVIQDAISRELKGVKRDTTRAIKNATD